MIAKLAYFIRLAAPAYLSLFSILSNYKVHDTNPSYAKEHPIRAGIYDNIFDSPSIVWVAVSLWALIELASLINKSRENPKQNELIKFILNQYRDKAFNIEPGDPEDHHRVTLFKYKRKHFQLKSSYWVTNKSFWSWLGRFWPKPHLVFFLRSGKLSQTTNVVFPVYDESDKTNGWAAHVWSTGCAAIVDHLPDPSNGGAQEYATKTKSTIEVVERYCSVNRAMPRAIAAIPIEVHGAAWGVLVLDSRRPNGVSKNSIDNFKITVAAIQKILEVRI